MPDSADPRAVSRRYRWYVLGVLTLMNAFAFTDRGIIGTLGQAVKVDLRLSDTQLGLLAGLGFAIFYGLFGIPIARLADRGRRSAILSIAVTFWSLMTAACGLALNFWQLLAARVGVGIGEAGSTIAHPLISDLFPPQRRASALSIFALGAPIGISAGTIFGAWIAERFGWRSAFFAVGLPGVLVALTILTTVREIPRGHSDSGPAPVKQASFVQTVRFLFGKKSFLHMIIAISVFGIGMISNSTFVQPFLVRHFGMSYAQAALVYAASFGLAAVIGLLSGGFLADRLGSRDKRFFVWLPAIGVTAAGTFYGLAFLQSNPWASAACFFIAVLFSSWYMAPSWALAQNLAHPAMRATAAALVVFTMNVLASAIGPALVGRLSDVIAAQHFPLGEFAAMCPGGMPQIGASAGIAAACAQASSRGLQMALIVSCGTFYWGAIHYLIAARTVRRDLDYTSFEAPSGGLDMLPPTVAVTAKP